jgi:NADH-quinone oxidoreductase subunit K
MLKYLLFSFFLFSIGILGIFVTRKNIIVILMSLELMLLSANVNFIVYSVYLNEVTGHIFSLFILTVAAAESAIGLALVVAYFRVRGTVGTSFINTLKG